MFTQCDHCQAIFRVKMREVTVAKGQLRCGECHSVFNASASLSTTMPKPYSEKQVEYIREVKREIQNKKSQPQRDTDIPAQSSDNQDEEKPRLIKGVEEDSDNHAKWLKIAALVLATLLILQVLYNYRHVFDSANKYQPEKIQMLNHNVFAHPIEAGVLLISASIENTAEFDQRYPILEVRLTNSKSELVALRRFDPSEYLDNYQTGMLIKKNQTSSLKMKIKDPGNQATRFQFDFL